MQKRKEKKKKNRKKKKERMTGEYIIEMMEGLVFSVCLSKGCSVSLLEEQCAHASNFTLLFYKDLKVLVDDGHSQKDSCTRTNGTQEVRHDRQSSYTQTTKCSSCRDVPVDDLKSNI